MNDAGRIGETQDAHEDIKPARQGHGNLARITTSDTIHAVSHDDDDDDDADTTTLLSSFKLNGSNESPAMLVSSRYLSLVFVLCGKVLKRAFQPC
mmetsp:Transcript_27416/g.63436  ORF Transcript_27416/g.63436 Transcript_27416/m.63436 type:complete len:95 (+) Transcript_27416:2344-2628(+)